MAHFTAHFSIDLPLPLLTDEEAAEVLADPDARKVIGQLVEMSDVLDYPNWDYQCFYDWEGASVYIRHRYEDHEDHDVRKVAARWWGLPLAAWKEGQRDVFRDLLRAERIAPWTLVKYVLQSDTGHSTPTPQEGHPFITDPLCFLLYSLYAKIHNDKCRGRRVKDCDGYARCERFARRDLERFGREVTWQICELIADGWKGSYADLMATAELLAA